VCYLPAAVLNQMLSRHRADRVVIGADVVGFQAIEFAIN
jgi:hypothetical protein